MNALPEKETSAERIVMRSPREVVIEITSTCNLRCRYCYYFSNEAVAYRDLPTDEWLSFFEELGRAAVMNVVLQGGEPFMRSDLRELLQGLVDNRMRFSILSNGGLIDDEMAAFIAGTGRCDYVQVSVDGATPAVHDATRGKGSFEGAVNGIRTLQRNGVTAAVRVTISHANVAHLDAIARFLLEGLNLPGFTTNAAGYLGSCRLHAKDVMLSVRERVEAMERLAALSRTYPGRISATAGPHAEVAHWHAMEQARKRGDDAWPMGGRLTGCGCPMSRMAVRADGVMVPCSMLAHMEMGRINEDSLVDTWRNSPVLRQLRARHDIPLSRFAFCEGCPYTLYCTGNCPGLSYTLVGEVDHPSPDACLRAFLAQGGRIVEP